MPLTATIVTATTGGVAIAFDYSPYLERIASSLERIVELSTSTGIRTVGQYNWTKPVDIYSWYNQSQNTLTQSTSTVEALLSDVTTIANNLPKFL